MSNKDKTKEQLLDEVAKLRSRVAELEKAESESKQAEEALKESETQLRALYNASFESLFLSEKGVCLDQNETAERMFGYTLTEAVGRQGTEWIAPDDRARVKDNMLSGLEEAYEVVALRKDGTTFPAEIQARMLEHKGRSIRMTALRNITVRKQAEEELHTSEERYRLLAENASDVIWTMDMEQRITYFSPSIMKLHGYTPEEAMEFSVEETLTPESYKIAVAAIMDEMARDGEPGIAPDRSRTLELEQIRKDGSTVWTEVSTSFLRDKDGSPTGIVGISRDITERKLVEEAIQASEKTYRDLLTNLSAGIVVHAPDTAILLSNPAAASILGLSEDQMSGIKAMDPQWKFLRDDGSDMPLDEYPVNQVLSTNKPLRNLVVGVNRPQTGDVAWALVNGFPVHDGSGQLEQAIISFVDITDRKRAEEALKESESQFRDLFEFSPQAIALTEVDSGKLVRVNRKFLELTKYPMDEIVGRTTTEVGFYPEKDRERFKSELLSSGNVSGMVMEFKTKDNSTINTLMFATVIPIEGKPHILSMFQDITEQCNLEAQLRHNQKLESIGTLASGVAHEINNPITSILNFAELIQMRTKEDERLADYTQRIINDTLRVADIVKNLLSFARQEKEQHSPAFMADIVNDTLGLIAAVFRKDQINITVDVRDDLPKIRCRSQQIQQVLMNLFTNARDALNERYPEFVENKILKITCMLFEKEDEKWFRTTVENHGGAIPPEVMDRIFDPFFTTKPRDVGTGLGLSISYGIVKEHKGELSVESDDNSTRFHMDLRVNNGWSVEK